MVNDFRTVRLGEVAEIIGGGTPSTKNPENYNGDIPWITPKDLSNHKYRYITHGSRNITEEGLNSSAAKMLPENAVLFTSRAPIGYVALAKNEVATNQGFKSLVLKDENVPTFFYYLMKHCTPKIKSVASGSTFAEVSGSVLKSIEVDIPDVRNQKAIAHILGALDDKIELNQKMNQNLEEIAKAIFKSWFVDFNPVRAKAEGRTTGFSPEISDLFPDELVDSEIGVIPKGWEVKSADSLFNITIGRTPPRKESHWFTESERDVPWVSIRDMGDCGTFISKTSECLTLDAVSKHRMRTLPAGSVLVSFKLTVGRVAITTKDMTTNEAIAHFPPSDVFPYPNFAYFYLKGFGYDSLGSTSSIATAVNSKMIKAIPFMVAPPDLTTKFEKTVLPMIERVRFASEEIHVLSELRDTLLPKFISGELQIPDAEKFIEEAGILMALVTEDLVEYQTIDWFKEIGYQYACGYDIALDGDTPEREDYTSVILKSRLLSALQRLNPDIPQTSVEHALSQLLNPNIPALVSCNRQVHSWLTKGIKVEFDQDGQTIGKQLKVIDYDDHSNNDWLVVNQFTVQGVRHKRRPDLVVLVNGLPLSVIELKNAADENADIWAAFNQLQTYKNDIPDLFNANVCLVISDGIFARMGSLTADEERFMRWRTIDGETLDPLGQHHGLETLVKGIFDKEIFLNYLRYFCLFEDDKTVIKKIVGYHQFHAVQAAVESVVTASATDGNKKGGVVWHTQGAGKSIEMACLAGRLISEPRLENPTLVMVTDRQDLDGQLFGVFAGAGELLGEAPKQADSRSDLRDLLADRPSGGIIFTTIQKFGLEKDEDKFPALTDRHNIIVIADEAHRTQYGFKAKVDSETGQIKYGLAKSLRDALPNATFLAFTGTPISQDDRDTQAVFGNYVSIYDIQQAVDDGATVPIYYESRLAKIDLNLPELPKVDEDVEDILDSETADEREKEKAKTQWSALAAIVGSEPRLKEVAQDLIEHYEARSETQPGKAMIVTMSREICVRLYDQIIALKPVWHADDHMKGMIKVVMTASASDKAELQPHHTNNKQKKDLEKRFKDPADPLKIVIVRDMWLTGFDAPCLATMYVDKPMQGANLAQAIARVNRVFKDKPGGLVVDYIGIAPQLKEALATYSAAKGKGRPTIDSSEAFRILKEKLQIARDILHPVDWSGYETNALPLIPECMDHILGLDDGKRRYCDTVLRMTKAFALCGTLNEALEASKEVAFHQAVRAPLIKNSIEVGPPKDTEFELRQLLSRAIIGEGVTDVFKLAGLENPDISILSDEFLKEVMKMPHKNLAVELLQRLIKDEVKTKFKTNVVKQRKFSDLLEQSLGKYASRAIEAAQVIEELIELAKRFREDYEREGENGLSPEESAFYDALVQNASAQEVMGEEILLEMAREVAKKLRENVTVDWAVRDSVRARLRILIRNLLKRYKYPPDQQKDTVDIVLRQAEVLSEDMTA